MAEDNEIIGTDIFWSASKSKAYRALIERIFGTLVIFLQEHGLVTRTLLPRGAAIDERFVIRRSDLTDEGFEFYRRVEQRWFSAIDKGLAPTDTSLLDNTLRTLRNEASRDS
jgi:hypothetical protein